MLKRYDDMEMEQNKDGVLVYGCDDMWRLWKGIRNTLADNVAAYLSGKGANE